jgi:hypothetical protein
MAFPVQQIPAVPNIPPFKIMPADGDGDGNWYMVSNGFIFDTFSYDVYNSVPILGLLDPFDLKPNHKIYLEIGVDSELQVMYSEIKCSEVGTEDNWKYYPFHSLIEPEFKDESEREKLSEFPFNSGRVLRLPSGRRQTKLYILIGYRADDPNKNGKPQEKKEEEETNNENQEETNDENQEKSTRINPSPVQILSENIILLGGTVDFAPGLIPIPYFWGGKTHLEQI